MEHTYTKDEIATASERMKANEFGNNYERKQRMYIGAWTFVSLYLMPLIGAADRADVADLLLSKGPLAIHAVFDDDADAKSKTALAAIRKRLGPEVADKAVDIWVNHVLT